MGVTNSSSSTLNHAPFEQTFTLSGFAGQTFRFSEEIEGFLPDAGYVDALKLDLEKSFYPFGQQPQPGTSFYFSSAEAFGKPGAQLRLRTQETETAIGNNPGTGTVTTLSKTLSLEYWNGSQWQPLPPTSNDLVTFVEDSGELAFTIPDDLEKVKVNDKEAFWLRLRLLNNTFGRTREIKWKQETITNSIVLVETTPPALRLAQTRVSLPIPGPSHPGVYHLQRFPMAGSHRGSPMAGQFL